MNIKVKISSTLDKSFLDFTTIHYENPLFLRSKSTQFVGATLEYGLCAYGESEDAALGRLAIFSNNLLRYNNELTWTLGLYECIDREEVAYALFSTATALAQRSKVSYLIGPMNGSTWNNYRISSDNSNLFFTDECNKDYYVKQFRENGFEEVGCYYSSIDRNINIDLDTKAIEEKLNKQGLKIRNIDLTDYEAELEKLYEITMNAFENNMFFTPIDKEAFIRKYLPIKDLLTSEFVFIAEDRQKKVVGYAICIHDYYNSNEKSLIVKTMARKQVKEWSGLGQLLSKQIVLAAKANDYVSIIHAFIYSENRSLALSKLNSGEVFKKYFLYAKSV